MGTVTWFETKMTSDTLPSPLVASASSVFQTTSKPAYLAFNGVLNGSTDGWRSSDNGSQWIQIDLGTSKKFNKLKLTSVNNSNFSIAMPVSFQVLGSTDGTNFTVLDSYSGLSWTLNETKEFSFKNSKEYRFYRLNLLQTSYAQYFIAEIMFGYEEKLNKTLILSGNKYKKYGNKTWTDLSYTSPTSTDFLNDGFEVSTLNRSVQTLNPQAMTQDTAWTEGGKVFKKSIDLKKYFDIRSINITN